jgi:hypothetical protein
MLKRRQKFHGLWDYVQDNEERFGHLVAPHKGQGPYRSSRDRPQRNRSVCNLPLFAILSIYLSVSLPRRNAPFLIRPARLHMRPAVHPNRVARSLPAALAPHMRARRLIQGWPIAGIAVTSNEPPGIHCLIRAAVHITFQSRRPRCCSQPGGCSYPGRRRSDRPTDGGQWRREQGGGARTSPEATVSSP